MPEPCQIPQKPQEQDWKHKVPSLTKFHIQKYLRIKSPEQVEIAERLQGVCKNASEYLIKNPTKIYYFSIIFYLPGISLRKLLLYHVAQEWCWYHPPTPRTCAHGTGHPCKPAARSELLNPPLVCKERFMDPRPLYTTRQKEYKSLPSLVLNFVLRISSPESFPFFPAKVALGHPDKLKSN